VPTVNQTGFYEGEIYMKLSLLAKEQLEEVDHELILIRHELSQLQKNGKINQEQFLLFSRLIKICMSLQVSVISAVKSAGRESS
jgi:hypothetical protein